MRVISPVTKQPKTYKCYKILEKFQKWLGAEPIAQGSIQTQNFSISGQKLHKMRYQSFQSVTNFAKFLELYHKFCPRLQLRSCCTIYCCLFCILVCMKPNVL